MVKRVVEQQKEEKKETMEWFARKGNKNDGKTIKGTESAQAKKIVLSSASFQFC